MHKYAVVAPLLSGYAYDLQNQSQPASLLASLVTHVLQRYYCMSGFSVERGGATESVSGDTLSEAAPAVPAMIATVAP